MSFIDIMNANNERSQLGDPDDYIQSPNTMPYFVDGDTIDKGGVRFRLQGFDTPEISKILRDGTLKRGTAGGQSSVGIMSKLANDNGFTNIRPVLNSDGSIKKDVFGRTFANLVDSGGNLFKDKKVY